MALRKCPRCELNYIKDDEKYWLLDAMCLRFFALLKT